VVHLPLRLRAGSPTSQTCNPGIGKAVAVGDLLLGAFALMLIVEGLLPFLSPDTWRQAFIRATQMTDGQIRFFGLTSIVIGLLLLAVWR
jgi:uncharacterized protein